MSARQHLMCTASAVVSEFIFELAALLSRPVACSQSCILGQTFAYYFLTQPKKTKIIKNTPVFVRVQFSTAIFCHGKFTRTQELE
jgi:hypothetical protein